MMSNETKREVFDELLKMYRNSMALTHEEPVILDNDGYDVFGKIEKSYDAALPDDLPVIPEAVSEYTKRMIPILGGPYIRDDVWTEPLFSIFLTIQHNLNKDYPPDFKAENWIIDHSDTFARAWVLGVWRVEETGEVVKL